MFTKKELDKLQKIEQLVILEYRLQQVMHASCCREYLTSRYRILIPAIRDEAFMSNLEGDDLCAKFIAKVHARTVKSFQK